MENNDNNQTEAEKQYHPIDHAFFTEWLAAQQPFMTWLCWFYNNAQLAAELHEAAFDATLSGRRRWPTNVTLLRHLKDAARSINRNRRKNLSELKLDPQIEAEPGDNFDDEHTEAQWFEPPVDLDMRNLEHLRTPEDLLDEAQGTQLAERMAEEVFEMTAEGSLEQRILLEARNENHQTSDVAKALGVDPRKVQRAKSSLRIKVRAVLEKHGLQDPKEVRKARKAGKQ